MPRRKEFQMDFCTAAQKNRQLLELNLLCRAFAQGRGGELLQLGVGALPGMDAFLFAVAGLLLEKPREIHDRAGLVLGQSVHDANQLLGCRTHGQRLNRHPMPCNREDGDKVTEMAEFHLNFKGCCCR